MSPVYVFAMGSLGIILILRKCEAELFPLVLVHSGLPLMGAESQAYIFMFNILTIKSLYLS